MRAPDLKRWQTDKMSADLRQKLAHLGKLQGRMRNAVSPLLNDDVFIEAVLRLAFHASKSIACLGMARECQPVWRDLARHRIYEGQPVDDVIKHTNPKYVVRHGRFVELRYEEPFSFTGVQIVAMDGTLTRACTGSCTWDHTFFDSIQIVTSRKCPSHSTRTNAGLNSMASC